MSSEQLDLAWIGTGIMGAPMARRLLHAGHRVAVFNRSADKARALAADGAQVAASTAEAARNAQVVFIMVSDTPDVEEVVAAISPALARGTLVVDMSTISPAATRHLAHRLETHGVEFLDAPVSGGEPGAISGALTIMAGGSESAFNRARPLLEHLGQHITHMGPSGSGQTAKLVNQVAVALNMAAAAESLTLAIQAGLDPATTLEAIGAGGAASWQLNNLGPKIIARDYRASFFVKLLRKNLRLVGELAQETKTPLPGLAIVTTLYQAATALGHDLDGHQALAAVLAAMAGRK